MEQALALSAANMCGLFSSKKGPLTGAFFVCRLGGWIALSSFFHGREAFVEPLAFLGHFAQQVRALEALAVGLG